MTRRDVHFWLMLFFAIPIIAGFIALIVLALFFAFVFSPIATSITLFVAIGFFVIVTYFYNESQR
jgi:hypothetical protein